MSVPPLHDLHVDGGPDNSDVIVSLEGRGDDRLHAGLRRRLDAAGRAVFEGLPARRYVLSWSDRERTVEVLRTTRVTLP